MAADWIKIEHGLPSKPEVMELADLLGISDNEAVGLLVQFWLWVDENLSPSCPVAPGTMSRIDRVVRRDGFATALQQVGWLAVESDVVSIPNYDHHLSQSAKHRAVEARKKRKQREKMSRPCPPANGTQQGTREEKRREEKKKEPPASPKGECAFAEFWKVAHTKTGKTAAAKAHARAVKRVATERGISTAEAAEYIRERMLAFAASPSGNPTDYTPVHPATWLNQGRYDDDPAVWERDGAKQQRGLNITFGD